MTKWVLFDIENGTCRNYCSASSRPEVPDSKVEAATVELPSSHEMSQSYMGEANGGHDSAIQQGTIDSSNLTEVCPTNQT